MPETPEITHKAEDGFVGGTQAHLYTKFETTSIGVNSDLLEIALGSHMEAAGEDGAQHGEAEVEDGGKGEERGNLEDERDKQFCAELN